MSAVTLKAHYDGAHIVLDEPFDLPANAALAVTILEDDDTDRADFLKLSSSAFADAFDADEVEYSEADLRR